MSEINSAAGMKVSIGPAEGSTRAATATAMAALTPFVPIKLTESVGDYGDEQAQITFTALEDSRVRKAKGPSDAGDMTITVGRKVADPGQVACVAAQASNSAFAFKVEYPDGGVDYFWGLVRSKRSNNGNATAVLRRTFTVSIDSPVYEVAPA